MSSAVLSQFSNNNPLANKYGYMDVVQEEQEDPRGRSSQKMKRKGSNSRNHGDSAGSSNERKHS